MIARVILPVPKTPNERWSTDFVADSIVTGWRFRALVIVDDYSRECPAIEVDLPWEDVEWCRHWSGYPRSGDSPEVITIDNGPEFAGKALDEWAYRRGVKLDVIRPGNPIENAHAEGLIGRLRYECLNENWFISLKNARDIIKNWRIDYNEGRPHTSLGGLAPKEYVENTGETLTAGGL